MNVTGFVATCFLSASEGREYMTAEEAEITLTEWRKEGMDDIPSALTPEIFAEIWNRMVTDMVKEMEARK